MALKFNGNPPPVEPKEELSPELTCGIVMPISPIDGCSAEHWIDVRRIIEEAVGTIAAPCFIARLVSEADDVGVIQKRIVQSLYNNEIVVCDVSCKNPNVMFELGLRLAFDKPTVIVKDDKTDYPFDTGIIEHVQYPRDLRFGKIVDFKTRLAGKIAATYHAGANDKNYSPFLKNFGEFTVASIDQKEVSGSAAVLAMLSDVQRDLAVIKQRVPELTSSSRAASLKNEWNVLGNAGNYQEQAKIRAIILAVIRFLKSNPESTYADLLNHVATNRGEFTEKEVKQIIDEAVNMLHPTSE